MANYLYVDNSNVWIEGMHVSAVEKGMTPNIGDAIANKVFNTNWRIDFGKLHELAGGDDIGGATLYGSRPPKNDSLWNMAEKKGFKYKIHERSLSNKEKKIDTDMSCDIVADSYEIMNPKKDVVTIVAGDRDYVPAINKLRARGFDVNVYFWEQASNELKSAASKFISLNSQLNYLAFK